MSSPGMLRLSPWMVIACLTTGCGQRAAAVGTTIDRGDASVATSAKTLAQGTAATAITGRSGSADALRLTEHGGTWTATNSAQGFSTKIGRVGAIVEDLSARWKLGLHLTKIGRPGALFSVSSVGVAGSEREVRIDRGNGVQEWFVHDLRGLEQGIDVETRPSGPGELLVEVAAEGLAPNLRRDVIEFRDARGIATLWYGQIRISDAANRTLPVRVSLNGVFITLHVDDTTATFPLRIDPLVWGVQQAELPGSTSGALDGSTALVGITDVFVQSGVSWTKQATLPFSPTGPTAVALSGGMALVGPDVFARSGTTWLLQSTLAASDGTATDGFSTSVALSGTTAVVGAPNATVGSNAYQGAAYVFVQNGTTWGQKAELHASDGAAYDNFGAGVAIADSTVFVGATGKGAVYVFAASGATWVQQQELSLGNGVGAALALGGGLAIVGAPDRGKPFNPVTPPYGAAGGVGFAYVLASSGTSWSKQATLMASDASPADCFGNSVAIESGIAVVGATRNGYVGTPGYVSFGLRSSPGAAYVFTQSGSTWTQQLEFAPTDGHNGDQVGSAVAVSGSTVLVTGGASYIVVPGHTTGDGCSGASDCLSGFCADGVCCATACTGSKCQACSTALTGASNGTCANVSAGKDPHGDCPGTACTSGQLTLKACDGNGACTSTPTSCAPFSCNAAGTACATSCAVDTDCGTAGFCNSGTCEAKGSNSATCTAGNQCSSGFCVDGVCCNNQCTGQCQACAETGNVGNCIAVKGIPRTPRADCTGTGTACYGQCDGINIASCGYPSIGASCGTGCTNGQHSICDNTGVCQAPVPCPGNLGCANVAACSSSCVVDADCAPSFICTGGKCQTKPPATCSADGVSSIPAGDAGPPQSCAPYICDSTGACKTACNTTSDCVAGGVCDLTKSPGQCVVTATTSSGGGCAVGTGPNGAGGGDSSLVGLAFAIGATARRRRRRS
ncbi:MAG: hypothetical protein ACHREM_15575 [Polyangiales bacterium]